MPLLLRLGSILAQLPLDNQPPRVLEVGCGAYPAAQTVAEVLPGWTFYGLDSDGEVLRYARCIAPALRLVQADARGLPGLLSARFGLILVRHPDVFRSRAAWQSILPALPVLLSPGGVLLITLYTTEEREVIETFGLPPLDTPDESALVPADLAGCDRLALFYRATTIDT